MSWEPWKALSVAFASGVVFTTGFVAPVVISAQARQNIDPMTDEQYRQFIADADAVAVQEINRHDAYAVAARYWDDAIDISPAGIASGRSAIEQRFTEEFNRNDLKDFAETIDAAHVSDDSGWFVGHWSATYVSGTSDERRSVKGYVAAMLERRNGEWKARIHITNYSR
jgi:ketosteroid isomerase-like protein